MDLTCRSKVLLKKRQGARPGCPGHGERNEVNHSNFGWLPDLGNLFNAPKPGPPQTVVQPRVNERGPVTDAPVRLSVRPGRSPERRASDKTSTSPPRKASPFRKGSASSASPDRAPHRHHRRSPTSPTRLDDDASNVRFLEDLDRVENGPAITFAKRILI